MATRANFSVMVGTKTEATDQPDRQARKLASALRQKGSEGVRVVKTGRVRVTN